MARRCACDTRRHRQGDLKLLGNRNCSLNQKQEKTFESRLLAIVAEEAVEPDTTPLPRHNGNFTTLYLRGRTVMTDLDPETFVGQGELFLFGNPSRENGQSFRRHGHKRRTRSDYGGFPSPKVRRAKTRRGLRNDWWDRHEREKLAQLVNAIAHFARRLNALTDFNDRVGTERVRISDILGNLRKEYDLLNRRLFPIRTFRPSC